MISTTFAIRLSFRAAYGWGYEVAAIEADKKGIGLGIWHATREAAEQQLDTLERRYRGSTLRERQHAGCD
jgi:hypothetical protein